MLPKRRGKFRRFIIAIWLCQSLDLKASITNNDDKPKDKRKSAMKVPAKPITVKLDTCIPKIIAIMRTTDDCASDLKTLERTFPTTIEPRATSVLSTLFRNPNRLSHTIDIPLNIEVKSITNDSIPIERNEK